MAKIVLSKYPHKHNILIDSFFLVLKTYNDIYSYLLFNPHVLRNILTKQHKEKKIPIGTVYLQA